MVEQIATDHGTFLADNLWYRFTFTIPSNCNPGPDSNNWWWSLNYRTTAAVTSTDTITVRVSLQGNPAHLLIG